MTTKIEFSEKAMDNLIKRVSWIEKLDIADLLLSELASQVSRDETTDSIFVKRELEELFPHDGPPVSYLTYHTVRNYNKHGDAIFVVQSITGGGIFYTMNYNGKKLECWLPYTMASAEFLKELSENRNEFSRAVKLLELKLAIFKNEMEGERQCERTSET